MTSQNPPSTPNTNDHNTNYSTSDSNPIETDVIVVGAGLSGISAIHRLRAKGLKLKVFEAGEDFGGVWHWNRYPGARVDSEAPFYQLNIPEVSFI